MEDKTLKLLSLKGYSPSNVPELLKRLGLPPNRQQELQQSLQQLEKKGLIVRTKGNRYIKSLEADLVPGTIRINRQGKGFLQPDEAGLQEIVIAEAETSTAMHGDHVLVRRHVKSPKNHSGEAAGAVVRILERKRMQTVGTLQQSKQFLYVIPDDPRIPHDIYVPPPNSIKPPARIGDKVVVELKDWASRHLNPEGEIIEVLGAPDAQGVDMQSVLRQYSLPSGFPKNVLDEAGAIAGAQLSDRVSDLNGRVDCRSHAVITIDPDDGKDFDDAIYLEASKQGGWKLWVHIADVSHYVRPGSALDVEAKRRGNSTYLVDRVIPMLPEALSNGLCSLKPNTDRLTKCVEFLLSKDGVVLTTRFYSAIIRSQRRFTYKEAFDCLQRHPVTPIDRLLHQASDLAQRIRRARFKAGSLDLDFAETKIRLDDMGRVLRIEKVENDISHQLVEEFMLLANEATATRLMRSNQPALYRVHEPPEARRLAEFREDVMHHHLPCGNLSNRAEVQKLLQRLSHLSIGPALKIGFLKSLMRARYATEPLGHYGLNKRKYTHFTSPIRRYADLEVHRALFEKAPQSLKSLRETAIHLSETERNSADAERDSKDMKMFAYLQAQMACSNPANYPGLVKEVRNFGFFVEVPDLGMSGLVHLSSIEDEFFNFDPSRSQLVGRRRRRIIKAGDRVVVRTCKVDTFKKQVDFQLIKSEANKSATAPGFGAASPSAGDRTRKQVSFSRGKNKWDQSAPSGRHSSHRTRRGNSQIGSSKPGKMQSSTFRAASKGSPTHGSSTKTKASPTSPARHGRRRG